MSVYSHIMLVGVVMCDCVYVYSVRGCGAWVWSCVTVCMCTLCVGKLNKFEFLDQHQIPLLA